MLRVLPRDAFNDASLLKCIGKITLDILDNKINGLQYGYDGEPFNIVQQEDSGNTFVDNIHFYTATSIPVYFYRGLNSRDNYPICFVIEGIDEEFKMFNEDGSLAVAADIFLNN